MGKVKGTDDLCCCCFLLPLYGNLESLYNINQTNFYFMKILVYRKWKELSIATIKKATFSTNDFFLIRNKKFDCFLRRRPWICCKISVKQKFQQIAVCYCSVHFLWRNVANQKVGCGLKIAFFSFYYRRPLPISVLFSLNSTILSHTSRRCFSISFWIRYYILSYPTFQGAD